jgi:hypothetical protein
VDLTHECRKGEAEMAWGSGKNSKKFFEAIIAVRYSLEHAGANT